LLIADYYAKPTFKLEKLVGMSCKENPPAMNMKGMHFLWHKMVA